jgi:uncharacterized protein (DUF697 family)
VDQAKAADPMAMPSDYGEEAMGKAIAGSLAGGTVGAVGGAGIKAIKKKIAAKSIAKATEAAGSAVTDSATATAAKTLSKLASEEIDELFKQAEMNVPSESEKKKENNVAPDEKSTEEPKKTSNEEINPKTGLKDIHCEVCGYVGQPDEKGFCPECGTLGGVKPQNPEHTEEMLAPSHDYGGDINTESENSFNE